MLAVRAVVVVSLLTALRLRPKAVPAYAQAAEARARARAKRDGVGWVARIVLPVARVLARRWPRQKPRASRTELVV